jgi:hypothetical protein
MDLRSIQLFNSIDPEWEIFVPEGFTTVQGHIVLPWPEYRGKKKGMMEYYEKELAHFTESQLNSALHAIVSVIVPQQ